MPETEQRRYSAPLAESDIRRRRHPRPRCTKVDSARRCPCTPPLPHPPSHPSLHGARVSGYGVDAHHLRAHSRPRFPRVARTGCASRGNHRNGPVQHALAPPTSRHIETTTSAPSQPRAPARTIPIHIPPPPPSHSLHYTPAHALVEMYGVHTIRISPAERNGTGKGRRTNTRTRLRPPHSTFTRAAGADGRRRETRDLGLWEERRPTSTQPDVIHTIPLLPTCPRRVIESGRAGRRVTLGHGSGMGGKTTYQQGTDTRTCTRTSGAALVRGIHAVELLRAWHARDNPVNRWPGTGNGERRPPPPPHVHRDTRYPSALCLRCAVRAIGDAYGISPGVERREGTRTSTTDTRNLLLTRVFYVRDAPFPFPRPHSYSQASAAGGGVSRAGTRSRGRRTSTSTAARRPRVESAEARYLRSEQDRSALGKWAVELHLDHDGNTLSRKGRTANINRSSFRVAVNLARGLHVAQAPRSSPLTTMTGECIPANPDISGIGVRAAIYAQNLLCFAPVVAHLWDGNVSADEMRGVKDQSIGMLAIAFAILISTIIGAANVRSGQVVTSFHAAVILDLSWMNNTSTWIWFLLYAHHLTKPNEKKEGNSDEEKRPIPAIWSAWINFLLSPLRQLVKDTGEGTADEEKGASGGVRITIFQRAWYFVSEKPVLTLGSIHLSLMGAIGLWLWSNPSKFGTRISPCDPSVTVVGGAVRFSSPGLRIFSLAIYSLLIIPGLNLVPPFLFFLALHIMYNRSWKHHAYFWGRLEHFINSSARIPNIFHDFHGTIRRTAVALRRIPRSTWAIFRRHCSPSPDLESGTQDSTPSGCYAPAEPTPPLSKNHTAFLIVGLVCLAVINIILLTDIELTLRRNKRDQSPEEDEWGFGQILALLLLVVPFRDFVTSILDIREKVAKDKEVEAKIQGNFEEHLRKAVVTGTAESGIFMDLIRRGANPTVELEGDFHVKNLLQLAAYTGNDGLIRYLQEQHVKDKHGSAFLAAVRNKQFVAANLLKDGNKSDMQETIQQTIAMVIKLLEHSDKNVCHAAISCMSSLGAQAELQQEIQPAISGVVKLLEDSDENVRWAAINCLSSLGAQAELQQEIRPAISGVVKLLEDSSWNVREAAISCLSSLGAQAELQQEIRPAISGVVKLLEDFNEDVRQAAISCLSSLGAQAELQQEIRPAISGVVKLLEHSNQYVCQAAISCLSSLGAQAELQQEIWPAISGVVKLLEDSSWNVCEAAISCLSSLGAQAELQQEIRPAISGVVKLLGDSSWNIRQAAISCLSSLGAQAELQQEIRPAISGIVKLLEDVNEDVRQAAISCLSSLGAQAELQQEIRPAISGVVKLLEHSNQYVRQAAISCLSGLGAQAELQQEIWPAISGVVKLLEDSDQYVRQAAISCLSSLGAQAKLQQEIRPAISSVVKLLQHSNQYVCQAAISCLSSLGAQAKLQQEIRPAISGVVKLLEDSDQYVRQAAISCLSSLGAQAKLQQEIRPAISSVVKLLQHSNQYVRQAAISCLSSLGAQAKLQQEIWPAISGVVKLLEDSHEDVRQAAISCLSSLGAQVELQHEIQPVISSVVKLLEHSNHYVRRAAISCLSSLGAQAELQQEIRPAISGVVKLLEDSSWNVCQAAISCLSSLGAQAELQQEIRPAISGVVKLLEHSNQYVCQAVMSCLSSLGAQAELQQEIWPVISGVVKLLEDSNQYVRQAAISCLSSLGAQAELQQEIRPAISSVVKLLEDSNKNVRQAAISCLSSLGAQDSKLLLIAICEWTLPTPGWTGILASLPQIISSSLK
ncbi:armadillo-type protein [Mycena albidolilacea]|uniref:Vacuolar protein 8 n=1 Tax=Mycena albidolilacea TaxID=1033008 RepID=A0AAD7AJW7_9AGAR|nr:armadillo-type protein [Mycena albidolilacea]